MSRGRASRNYASRRDRYRAQVSPRARSVQRDSSLSVVLGTVLTPCSLGLTCDPLGGLVQIPCIERNSLGGASGSLRVLLRALTIAAVKAVTAAQLAMAGGGEHTVSYVVLPKPM